jgi:hypothetical protein
MTNDAMTNEYPMTNGQMTKSGKPGIQADPLPYWSLVIQLLVIDWSLVIGHWSFFQTIRSKQQVSPGVISGANQV